MAETVRFRPRWWQLPWYHPLVVGWLTYRLGETRSVTTVAIVGAVAAAVFGAEFAWLRGQGAELRPDALVVRGFDTEVVPWQAITAVGPTRLLGTTYASVHVGTRRIRLHAPQHTPFLAPDPEFDAKLRTIHEWWTRGLAT